MHNGVNLFLLVQLHSNLPKFLQVISEKLISDQIKEITREAKLVSLRTVASVNLAMFVLTWN